MHRKKMEQSRDEKRKKTSDRKSKWLAVTLQNVESGEEKAGED